MRTQKIYKNKYKIIQKKIKDNNNDNKIQIYPYIRIKKKIHKNKIK